MHIRINPWASVLPYRLKELHYLRLIHYVISTHLGHTPFSILEIILLSPFLSVDPFVSDCVQKSMRHKHIGLFPISRSGTLQFPMMLT